jgi:predicted ribosome-associated RNA-binding protein Tma20
MDKIKDYVVKKYPTKFKNKTIEVIEEDNFYKVFYKDGSPIFLSKNIEL